MSRRKEEARSSVSAPERAERENSLGCGISHSQFIISGAGGQGGISALLSPGVESGLLLSELVQITGLSAREIRRQIAAERRRGVPVLSDCVHGYFLPASEFERVACVRSMRHRAGEIMAVADALERAGGSIWDDPG